MIIPEPTTTAEQTTTQLASAAALKWKLDIDVTLAVADLYVKGFAGGRTAPWEEMLEAMAQVLRSEGYSIP